MYVYMKTRYYIHCETFSPLQIIIERGPRKSRVPIPVRFLSGGVGGGGAALRRRFANRRKTARPAGQSRRRPQRFRPPPRATPRPRRRPRRTRAHRPISFRSFIVRVDGRGPLFVFRILSAHFPHPIKFKRLFCQHFFLDLLL